MPGVSAAELCPLAPAGVERPANRAPVADRQIDGTAKAAVGGRVVHGDPAGGDWSAALAVAGGAASDLRVRRPPVRPRPYTRATSPTTVSRIDPELEVWTVPPLDQGVERGQCRAAQHEADRIPVPRCAARCGVRVLETRRRAGGLGLLWRAAKHRCQDEERRAFQFRTTDSVPVLTLSNDVTRSRYVPAAGATHSTPAK